ncbi:MAG: helix-turn-helix domain-containing protein [Candidatus Ornithomonoglobus sp.]
MERKNTDELYRYLGERIKSFRNNCGYTVEEAGKRLGIPPRTLTSYESGTRQIDAVLLIEVAALYGSTYENLTNLANIKKQLRLYRDLTKDEGEPVFDYQCLELDTVEY